MKTLLKLAAIFSLAVANGWLYGQSGHSVTLTVSSPDTSTTSPGTATVLRASGACPASGVPSSGTTLTSTLSVPASATFTDSTVVGGNTYCFWAVLKTQGGGTGTSNTFLGSISVLVTLSGTQP